MSDTIKEFLVGLGFDVDESSLKKFNSAIVSVAAPVLKLGAVVTATATTVEVMVERIARQMQDLYYAAQRTGVAAQTLQAVGYAAKQLGLDASDGTDLLEGFSRAMRTNPGMQAFLQQLGGQFQTVNGQVGLTDQGLNNVLETLAKMPRYQALLYAGVLGINPDTLNTILNNLSTFEDRAARASKMAQDFGLNLQDSAAKGNKFAQDVDTLGQVFEDLSIKAGVDWMPVGDKVLLNITKMTTQFGVWAAHGHESVIQFGSLAVAIGGVSGALKVLGALPAMGWLGTLATLLLRWTALATAAWALYNAVSPTQLDSNEDAYMKLHPELYPNAGGQGKGSFAAGDNFNAVVDYFEKAGWDHDHATAIALNFQDESNFNPRATNAGHTGIEQLDSHRWAAFEMFAQKRGLDPFDIGAQLQFAQFEMTEGGEQAGAKKFAAAKGLKDATFAFSENIERSGTTESIRRANQAGSITLNQRTQITVNGDKGSPAATAKAVGDAQTGVNDSMARNFAPVVR